MTAPSELTKSSITQVTTSTRTPTWLRCPVSAAPITKSTARPNAVALASPARRGDTIAVSTSVAGIASPMLGTICDHDSKAFMRGDIGQKAGS